MTALLSLGYRSWKPVFLHRYSPAFLFFFALLAVLSIQAWRIALDDRRWLAFARPSTAVPVLYLVAIAACAVFFLNAYPDLVGTVFRIMRRHIPELGFIAAGVLLLGLLPCSGADRCGLFDKTVLLLAGVYVSLGIAEAILWISNYEYSPLRIVRQDLSDWRQYHAFDDRFFIYDPELIWRPKKGCSMFNSQGYRGRVLSGCKEPGSFRIFAIGDSNTLGWADGGPNWPGYLEALLAEDRDGITVTNAGVYGYSSFQGLRRFKESLRFKPDMAVISFGGNDPHRVVTSDAEYDDRTARRLKLDRALHRCRVGQLIVAFMDRPSGKREHLVPRVAPDEYKNNVEEMIRLSNENGIRVVLLTRPFIGASPDGLWWKNFAPAYNALTLEIGRENRVMAIDVHDYFKDKKECFADDSHFNEKGHRLAAGIIRDNIEPLVP